ncbi:hypothetical protein ACFQH6_14545 [Halobacteriaceae archaeon GCM10025711]
MPSQQTDGVGQAGEEQLRVSFEPLASDDGIDIVDPIERHRYSLYTPSPVSAAAVDPDRFRFPVDAAVSVHTDAITLPTVVAVYVRDDEGTMLAEAEHFAHEEFPDGTYCLELCAPIKLYVRVSAPLTVSADAERTAIEFGEETEVAIGARSHHEHPAGTITTTDDPVDMMAAVSALGSALKTTTVERSYPTLRGHPPTIELGDELDIPEGLAPPDTGVRIELPPDYGHVFVAAPLAYYLGATLVPGPEARIVTDAGFEYALESPLGFEREVERVLKQTFFLDCVTRTEGYYQVDLHERRAIEREVDLDFADLYDRSLAEQLEAYLSVPYDVIADHVPDWKLSTHVRPTADSVEMLPFVVNDLAVVHTPRSHEVAGSELQSAAVEEFMRDGAFTRSASSSAPDVGSFVQPDTTDSLEQVWIGDGTPIGASKALPDAYRHRLDRAPADGDIDITVVCNDAEMMEERDIVDRVYGSRKNLPFDVTIHRGLTKDELRDVLTAQNDFFHYIGHVDENGFECTDGTFDARTLDEVGVDAFFLNACSSYEQGLALIERGSIGGVVTVSDVINSGAVRIGATMARLLNGGFPLRVALTIAKEESVVGGQYTVIGDGGLAIAQSESGAPNMSEIISLDDGYRIEITAYPTIQRGMGSLIIPYIDGNAQHFLNSNTISFELSKGQLVDYLRLENIPVKFDGELLWSYDLDIDRI